MPKNRNKARAQASAVVESARNTARIRPKKGVEKAHHKHRDDDNNNNNVPFGPAAQSLADRFYALPSELRALVFSFLVVQPTKWDMTHAPDCHRLLDPAGPHNEDAPANLTDYVCALDFRTEEATRWAIASAQKKSFTHAWRSKWAPPPSNPYVCARCYDVRLRPQPFPRDEMSISCLCARRRNLDVRLVCRRWCEEASRVFYTENTFAFGDISTFVNFTRNLPAEHRDKISKLSVLLAYRSMDFAHKYIGDNDDNDEDEDDEDEDDDDDDDAQELEMTRKNFSALTSLLRTYPSLSILELDACFLQDSRSVHRFLRLGLRNLRVLRFVRHTDGSDYPREAECAFDREEIWPHLHDRKLFVQAGGRNFVEHVARAIKGEKQMHLNGSWRKASKAVDRGVEEVWLDVGGNGDAVER